MRWPKLWALSAGPCARSWSPERALRRQIVSQPARIARNDLPKAWRSAPSASRQVGVVHRR